MVKSPNRIPFLQDWIILVLAQCTRIYSLREEREFISITDDQAMQWGLELSKMEGIIPAIESAHAFAVLDEMKFKPEDIVVINLSGRGDKDLNTYIDYFKL